MNIVIRVDASTYIGSGHLMRCLALAEELRTRGIHVHFISRELPGNMIDHIREKTFPIYPLPYPGRTVQDTWLGVPLKTDAEQTLSLITESIGSTDWLIIDQYGIDVTWEKHVSDCANKILVIDDLANRRHECDILLDCNLVKNYEQRYRTLLPKSCTTLFGPQYALLREEFRTARKNMPVRDGKINRIMVFFGGSDLTNETTKVLKTIVSLNHPDISVDVVIGKNNPHKQEIESFMTGPCRIICHYKINTMAELMLTADVYIGAAGITTWERCSLGLPSLVISVAENQIEPIQSLAKYNILYYIGNHDEITDETIKNTLLDFFRNPKKLQLYSRTSSKLVDALGAKRCADALFHYDSG